MEFSNRSNKRRNSLALAELTNLPESADTVGAEMHIESIGSEEVDLRETVITLTGLPENLVSRELDQILELAGHSSNDLTLDQLRAAMLVYLEQIQDSVQESL